jgi:hypothetical protein
MKPRYPTYRLNDDTYRKLTAFVDQLLDTGYATFAPEFERIDQFLLAVAQEPSERDAHGLRQSEKARYLLELVSFEIYDRLDREGFNRADKTLIVMPDCLSLHNPNCEKLDLPTGDVCRQCTEDCFASQITDVGVEFGVSSVFSKRKLEQQLEHYQQTLGDYGVVGIACVLMLASGMRSAHEVGIPARGVLLEGCGCEHWNDQPFSPQLALDRLRAILQEKYGRAD